MLTIVAKGLGWAINDGSRVWEFDSLSAARAGFRVLMKHGSHDQSSHAGKGYEMKVSGSPETGYLIQANGADGKNFGHLRVRFDGEVQNVSVSPEYRRQGIATAMWEHAKHLSNTQGFPAPKHSSVLTPEGEKWAEVVKHGSHDQSSHAGKGNSSAAPSRVISDKENEVRGFITGKEEKFDDTYRQVTANYQTPDGQTVQIFSSAFKGKDQEWVFNPDRPEITPEYKKGTWSGTTRASVNGKTIGEIDWHETRINYTRPNRTLGYPSGWAQIGEAAVNPNMRRQGIATAILAIARDTSPFELRHSEALSDDGKGFAAMTKDEVVKHGTHDQSSHGQRGNSTGSAGVPLKGFEPRPITSMDDAIALVESKLTGQETAVEAHQKIADAIGANGKPKEISTEDQYPKGEGKRAKIGDRETPLMYRGFGGDQQNKENGPVVAGEKIDTFMNGEGSYVSGGVYGVGTYFADSANAVAWYSMNGGTKIRAQFNPKAKVLDEDEFRDLSRKLDAPSGKWIDKHATYTDSNLSGSDVRQRTVNGLSKQEYKSLAMFAMGYDGAYVDDEKGFFSIWNRASLEVIPTPFISGVTKDESPDHSVQKHGSHDQSAHGRKGKSLMPMSPIDAAAKNVAEGKQVTIQPADTYEVLRKLSEGSELSDLANLDVAGTHLFDEGNLGLDRSEMPQVPSKTKDAFLAAMEKSGMPIGRSRKNPMDLKPIQKEISGKDAGGIMQRIEKTGLPDTDKSRIFISNDGYVLDGHHRWAAAAALHLSKGEFTVPVFEIPLPAKEAISMLKDWNTVMGISSVDLGERNAGAGIFKSFELLNPLSAVVIMNFFKHGTHDQSKHGNRGSGGSVGVPKNLNGAETATFNGKQSWDDLIPSHDTQDNGIEMACSMCGDRATNQGETLTDAASIGEYATGVIERAGYGQRVISINDGTDLLDRDVKAAVAAGQTHLVPENHSLYKRPVPVLMFRPEGTTQLTIVHEVAHILTGDWNGGSQDGGHSGTFLDTFKSLTKQEGFTEAGNFLDLFTGPQGDRSVFS